MSGIYEKVSNKGFSGNNDSFLLLTPIGANKGFVNVMYIIHTDIIPYHIYFPD